MLDHCVNWEYSSQGDDDDDGQDELNPPDDPFDPFDPFAPFLCLFGKLYGEGAAFAATATTPKGERLLLLQGVGARPLQLARSVGTRPLDVALSIMEPK